MIDGERQQLFKDGVQTSIQRKLYEILLVLVENAGNLVTKEELIDSVWQGREIDERNLTQHIYNLRRALGDNPRHPSFILTIPGKGYTFNHPVRLLDPAEMEALLNEAPGPGNFESKLPGIGSAGAYLSRLGNLIWSRLRSWRFMAIVGGIVFLVLLMLATHPSWWRRPRSGAMPYPIVATLPTVAGFKTDPGFSPDGQQIVFASGQSESSLDIYISSVSLAGQKSLLQLTTNPLSEHSPIWSPDGQQIAFLRGDKYDQTKSELVVIPSRGGNEKTIARVWGGLDWSPDGRRLAVIDEDGPDTPSSVYLISSDGSERQRLSEPVPGEWRYDSTPRFSPDGRSIAFIRWRGDIDGDIWVVDVETKRQRQLTNDRVIVTDLKWSNDGREILFASGRSGVGRLWRQRLDEATPVLVDSMVNDIHRFDVHPFQKRIVFTQYSQNTSIEVWPLEQGRSADNRSNRGYLCKIDAGTGMMSTRFPSQSNRVLTTSISRNFLNPRYSPNGKQLLFVSNLNGLNQLWIANADCSEPTQLTNFEFDGVGSPRWSPDGRKIAFDGRRSGPADVYIIDADGSNLRLVTEGCMPSWSADGRFIYYVSNRLRLPQVWKIPVAGGAPVKVTEPNSRDPLESADGKLLYFTNIDRLWQKDLVSGLESAVPGMEAEVVSRYWDQTPTGIYFGQPSGEKSDRFLLRHLDLRTGRVEVVLELKGVMAKWVPGISVSPDEQWISVSYLTNVLGEVQLLDDWN
ncbi:MAG: winged helix-turn-helix domain-containing protein [Acidobacteriota bacterium]